MHICHPATAQVVSASKYTHGTWRKVAVALGYPKNFATVLCQIAQNKPGAISAEGEDLLRVRMGFSPLYGVRVAPCPTCGDVHAVDDCHGKEGEPVLLADNEKIQPIRKQAAKRDTRHRLTVSEDNKAWLDEKGLSADAAVGWLRIRLERDYEAWLKAQGLTADGAIQKLRGL